MARMAKCPRCNGAKVIKRTSPGWWAGGKVPCPNCRGTGRVTQK